MSGLAVSVRRCLLVSLTILGLVASAHAFPHTKKNTAHPNGPNPSRAAQKFADKGFPGTVIPVAVSGKRRLSIIKGSKESARHPHLGGAQFGSIPAFVLAVTGHNGAGTTYLFDTFSPKTGKPVVAELKQWQATALSRQAGASPSSRSDQGLTLPGHR